MTYSFYLARFFALRIFLVWLLFMCLTLIGTMIELSRYFSKYGEAANYIDIFLLSLMRAPYFNEEILPFAILFAAIFSLYLWSRRLELVVARSGGISVWQFLSPLFVVALLMGIFTFTIYDPLALWAHKHSKVYESNLVLYSGNASPIQDNYLVRLPRPDGDAILRAGVSQDEGTRLSDASFYLYDESGIFESRYDARTAHFVASDDSASHGYELSSVKLITPGSLPIDYDRLFLPFDISIKELELRSVIVEEIDFWSLGFHADKARAGNRNPLPFETRYQSLLSLPFFFLAMVLLAGCVSLNFHRYGGVGNRIIVGIVGGFVLYILSELVLTFGNHGLLSPILVSYSPSFVAILLFVSILLHQEDG